MMNLGFANSKIILLILLLSVIAVIILMVSLFSRGNNQNNQTGQANLGNISTYNKTQPGKPPPPQFTNRDNFEKKTELANGSTVYTLKPASGGDLDIVVIEEGKVVFEKVIPINKNLEYPSFDTYVKELGNPEKEFQGEKGGSFFTVFYLYPSKGITLAGNPATREVYEIQTYIPMSLEEYMKKWGNLYIDPTTKEDEDEHL